MQLFFACLPLLLVLFEIFSPAILHPSEARQILLHGGSGSVILVTTCFLGWCFLIKFLTSRVSDPAARQALSSLLLRGSMILVGCGGFVVFATDEIRSGEALLRIQQHGQRTMAKVLNIYVDSCSNHGCSIYTKYQFTPDGASSTPPIIGYDFLASTQSRNDPHLLYARTNQQILVAYDTHDPSNFAVNFSDRVFLNDPMQKSFEMIAAIGFIFAVPLIAGWLISRVARRKAARAQTTS